MKPSRKSLCVGLGLIVAVCLVTAAPAAAQNAVLTGNVTSDLGEAVAGANVYILELGLTAGTNSAGRYTMLVPGERVRGQEVVVRVRAIGHKPNSRALTLTGGEHTMDFVLQRDVNLLEAVVVTGVTAETERVRSPINVGHVDATQIPVPASDPLRLLAGKVPGVNILSTSGRPGAGASIILRGPTSINASGRGQEPLLIVDGVITNGSLSDINPNDIENIEVVKGAAAASLYGARAGNGVVQITTKTGGRALEGVRFNVRSEVGVNDIERDFGLAHNTAVLLDASGQRFCQSVAAQPLCARTFDWRTEAARVNNAAGSSSLTPAGFPIDVGFGVPSAVLPYAFQAQQWPGTQIYNAVDQVVTLNPYIQNSVDMSGRFGETFVYASVGQLDQAGALMFGEGFQRQSARLNADQRIGGQWSIGVRTYYSRSVEDFTGPSFFRLTRVPAIANILQRDTLDRLYIRSNIQTVGQQNENPLQNAENIFDQGITDRFIGGANVRYTPMSWLDVEGSFSYDYRGFRENFFRDKGFRNTGAGFATLALGFVDQSHNDSRSLSSSVNLRARRQLGSDLLSTWSLRYLYEQQDNTSRGGEGGTLAAQGVPDLDNATASIDIDGSASGVRSMGLYVGGAFIFRDRYMLDALIRRDGTSLFGANNRWATFGRLALGWRLTQEPWWPVPALSEFKLRAAYGTAGGRPNFAAQYETFSVSTTGISFGTLGNSDLRPEITRETELGADVEIGSRVLVNLTYAKSNTRDQILLVPAPASTGFQDQWQNAATLENRTWELSVNVPVITRRDLQWSWRLLYDRTRTVVTKLNVPPFRYGSTSQGTGGIYELREGERYATFYGKRFVTECSQLPASYQAQCGPNGAFQQNDQGMIVWVGAGNSWQDGITKNLWGTLLPGASAPWGVPLNWGMLILERDATCLASPNPNCPAAQLPLGNGTPDWHFGISQNLTWKRLSVYALLEGVMGREVWNQGRHWAHGDLLAGQVDQAGKTVGTAKPLGYYWRSAPPDASGIGGFYETLAPNSFFVEDASFAKLRELALTYHVGPLSGLGDWTVQVVGRNLFTITGYTGFDPEVGQGGGIASSALLNAVDAFEFPNTRSFTFAVSTSF